MEKTITDMSNLKINESDVKNHLVYIKDKNGVYIINPFVDTTKKLLEIQNCTSLLLSPKNIAAVVEGKLVLYDLIDFNLLKTFDYESISAIDFSPNGKYLIIIQKPAVPFNLKVVDLESDYQLKISFHSTIHPNQHWPQIRFSKDEEFLFRQIKTNIDIFELKRFECDFKYNEKDTSSNNSDIQSQIISFSNVVNYAFAEIKVEENSQIAILIGKCLLDEKTKKKKSTFGFYRLSDCSKPIKEFPISLCDRMIIKVSPDNSSALVQSICDDTSNTSYYGESSLYYVDLLFGKFAKITTPDGPIHDFNWTPSNQFIVCAGFSPSKTTIYSNQNKLIKEICNSKVNLIRISPDGRILCMAGFGNMNGDLEFYNLTKDFKLIGKCNFYCGVTLNWSFDSKFLVGAVTSPRIRVDNEFRVITYNGEYVNGHKFSGEIYESNWVYSDAKVIGITAFEEFPLEVSKEYLKKLELDKQKAKNNTSTMRRLDMPLSAAAKKSSIPGMKK